MGPYDYYVGNYGVWRREIPLKEINLISNFRHLHKDLIQELAESIKVDGQLAPAIINRRVTEDGCFFDLLGGRHRYEACLLIPKDLRCEVYDNLPPEVAWRKQLAENIHRDPDSTEWANAIYENYLYFRSINLGDGSIADYCRKTGLHPAKVHNAVRFIERLDGRVSKFVYEGHLSYGVATELARIDDQEIQYLWGIEAIANGYNGKLMRSRVSHYLMERRGQLNLGNLFGGQTYQEVVKRISARIDPRLEKAAMEQIAWMNSLSMLIRSGHLPERIITPKRREALKKLRGVLDFLDGEVTDESPEQEAI